MTKTSITFFGHLSKIPNVSVGCPFWEVPEKKTNAKNGKRERRDKKKENLARVSMVFQFGSVSSGGSVAAGSRHVKKREMFDK